MTGPLLNSERLIVVVGPSGAGKDSVLQTWLRKLPPGTGPAPVRRVITRAPDPQGEGHESIDPAHFIDLRASDTLAFWWEAHGLHYGVRHTSLAPLGQGRWVVLNGSRAHLPQLRRRAPGARVVEVTAPPELLAARLAARRREDATAVAARLAREVPVSGAALVVSNTGDVAAAAALLDRWWQGLRREGD
ncbi:phosphonate metabolism protein/1,5-bisphosphokinase (PRPP-forming) PhnN [Aquabacterium sp. A7-Y]|uniref:phosphonate metabolism protein/1,5-bisphosphokinase (PRPP-forming) PhnN n=1 Tax=Aquabacterium sp. A7-Y TaxID=1349605 RepID=UPI00223D2B46|nr:phosphonate metabolism protein/1,5-bisphosphokinase (PRPP-forming) PhnN [Aquabacterium sp. A7-Y]MCW7541328.1 phosphonate metabolism protein/1,5-bisphosphokinase (PRPP-forming) PhnN [Aquabacterium sp. A7-Y]